MFFPAAFCGYNLYAFNLCNRVKRSKVGESFLKESVGRRSIKMPMRITWLNIKKNIVMSKKGKALPVQTLTF